MPAPAAGERGWACDAPRRPSVRSRMSPGSVDATATVTPSVLRPKQTTKSCHEHHVYVIIYVIESVDKFLVA